MSSNITQIAFFFKHPNTSEVRIQRNLVFLYFVFGSRFSLSLLLESISSNLKNFQVLSTWYIHGVQSTNFEPFEKS